MVNISACLVIHNEEQLLPRCLSSIKNIASEIIVVHDGPCTDKSLAIAKLFGAKIFTRPFIGEAEHHRPFALEKAKGDWILQIDGDEFLSDQAIKTIPQLINDRNIDAYSFFWPYSLDNIYIKTGPFSQTLKPCLFRKEKMFMIGISHEYPHTYGKLVKRADIRLEHKQKFNNYNDGIFRTKWINWAKLQAQQIYSLEKAPIFNITDKSGNQIYNNYLFMRRQPILSAIKDTLKFLLIYLSRGILWAGPTSRRIAYFELRYLLLVRIYLFKLKHGQQI